MKIPLAALTILGALVLGGCATSTPTPTASSTDSSTAGPGVADSCAGVSVVVDFGVLDSPAVADCVDTGDATAIAASEVMKTAGIATEGTVEWGDQIVCRVNGRPAADETVAVEGQASFVESCASMPPAYAYWALWIKPTADSEWEYAQEGVGTLQLTPGQTIGLVFTTGTETPTPGS